METQFCDRDKMLGMWENEVFSIEAAKKVGQSEGCIYGFIAELIQNPLRQKDSQGNKIPLKLDDNYIFLSSRIKDLDRATFDTIVNKLKPKFVKERDGLLYWQMDLVPNMPL